MSGCMLERGHSGEHMAYDPDAYRPTFAVCMEPAAPPVLTLDEAGVERLAAVLTMRHSSEAGMCSGSHMGEARAIIEALRR